MTQSHVCSVNMCDRLVFSKGLCGAHYYRLRRHGSFDLRKREPRYWTYDRCFEVAKLCSTKTEFRNRFTSAYGATHKNKWADTICSHMTPVGNKYQRYVYAIVDEVNRQIYIGLTFNLKRRWSEHQRSSRFDQGFEFVALTGAIAADKASALEIETVEKYRADGFIILNKTRAGGLGGSSKWSQEAYKEEATKYQTRSEFFKGSPGAYEMANRDGVLDDICGHMRDARQDPRKWSLELCRAEAVKFKTRSEFADGAWQAYQAARKHGWLNAICEHMRRPQHPRAWTFERCAVEATKYPMRSQLAMKNQSAYRSAKRNGWLERLYPK